MAKSHTTLLAEHEIRLNQIERLIPDLTATLKNIDKKLDENYISRREYDKRTKDQELFNQQLKSELDSIKENMMTQDQFKDFGRSQMWQKIMTGLGGAGITIIAGLVIYALTI